LTEFLIANPDTIITSWHAVNQFEMSLYIQLVFEDQLKVSHYSILDKLRVEVLLENYFLSQESFKTLKKDLKLETEIPT